MNPISPGMLCINFGCHWHSNSGKEDFKYRKYLDILSLSLFIFTNLNLLYPRMLNAKFGFLYVVNMFSLFCFYLPLVFKRIAVTWLKYCRYGVKLYPINKSIFERKMTMCTKIYRQVGPRRWRTGRALGPQAEGWVFES